MRKTLTQNMIAERTDVNIILTFRERASGQDVMDLTWGSSPFRWSFLTRDALWMDGRLLNVFGAHHCTQLGYL